jgi:6-phospho-beta-glucosidase
MGQSAFPFGLDGKMKITFIGAGGVRTPLVIESLLRFQDRLPLAQVCLMDVDPERLELMQLASKPRLSKNASFEVEWTTDAHQAIAGSDFIVTTFRVGGMESRVIDEQVPLKYGVLGQETTGPGGFAMALRTIPVMLDYVRLIRELAPGAWLLNFTNPAGMVTEAITRVAGYERAIGICDNPAAMLRGIAAILEVQPEQLYPTYYGLNHLGWLAAVYQEGENRVPRILQTLKEGVAGLPGLPFDIEFIEALGAIPNEYLYFFYSPQDCVDNLLRAGESRAQQIMPFNLELFASLRRVRDEEASPLSVEDTYARYLGQRHGTYMTLETGEPAHLHDNGESVRLEKQASDRISESAEGYSAVALNVIQALTGEPAALILNVPNHGAIPGMDDGDVVEVTCYVGQGVIHPIAVGSIPDHALGLMKTVKAYERLAIQAAIEGSYQLAVKALALHPLVPSYNIARSILDEYITGHGDYFPKLR